MKIIISTSMFQGLSFSREVKSPSAAPRGRKPTPKVWIPRSLDLKRRKKCCPEFWSWPFIGVRLWTVLFLNCNIHIWPAEAEPSGLTRSRLYMLHSLPLFLLLCRRWGGATKIFFEAKSKNLAEPNSFSKTIFSKGESFCWLMISFKFVCFCFLSFFYCCCF